MNLHESIKIGSIIGKYLVGKESREELEQLKSWLKGNSQHQKEFNSLKEEKNIGEAIEEFDSYNKKIAWEKYMDRIIALSFRKVLLRWKVAAVFFFLVGCIGMLAYINQERLTSIASNNYTTVLTQNGQNSKIILPDSSVVWINSGTSLSYNTNFASKSRDIHLTGQAFFEVTKNEKMPLTVRCNGLIVKVLGTRFDVSAYPEDKNISVVLESGKIELSNGKNQAFIRELKPGEMGMYNVSSGKLSLEKVYNRKFTSWKDGVLIFENDAMSDVFEKLERWYNIEIEVKSEKVYQLIFNATIVNETFDEIFELIKFTCGINYEIIPSHKPEIPVRVIITK